MLVESYLGEASLCSGATGEVGAQPFGHDELGLRGAGTGVPVPAHPPASCPVSGILDAMECLYY